jgi:hypothetical protein
MKNRSNKDKGFFILILFILSQLKKTCHIVNLKNTVSLIYPYIWYIICSILKEPANFRFILSNVYVELAACTVQANLLSNER